MTYCCVERCGFVTDVFVVYKSFSMCGPSLRVPLVLSYTCAYPVLDSKRCCRGVDNATVHTEV